MPELTSIEAMKQRLAAGLAFAALAFTSGNTAGYIVPVSAQQRPASAATIDVRKLDAIETLVREDIQQKRLPGAVVLIGVGDRTVYQKAFGDRAVVPKREPMTRTRCSISRSSKGVRRRPA